MAQTENIRLVLASQSPRRAELLRCLGLNFEVVPSQLDESTDLNQPDQIVESLAVRKAEAVAQQLGQSGEAVPHVVLGADTIVALGTWILGKPSSAEDAYQMLVRMSGRCHKVYTGIALSDSRSGKTTVAHAVSDVYFRSLDSGEMRAYARSEEPRDKAGGYALQGAASAFVQKIDGCYSNVIGLPVPLTVKLLRAAGISVLGLP